MWRSGHGRRCHDRLDRQAELLRKLVVALIVCWYRHDRPRAVPGEHVVGDPNRNLLAVDRVDRKGAGRHPTLLL